MDMFPISKKKSTQLRKRRGVGPGTENREISMHRTLNVSEGRRSEKYGVDQTLEGSPESSQKKGEDQSLRRCATSTFPEGDKPRKQGTGRGLGHEGDPRNQVLNIALLEEMVLIFDRWLGC